MPPTFPTISAGSESLWAFWERTGIPVSICTSSRPLRPPFFTHRVIMPISGWMLYFSSILRLADLSPATMFDSASIKVCSVKPSLVVPRTIRTVYLAERGSRLPNVPANSLTFRSCDPVPTSFANLTSSLCISVIETGFVFLAFSAKVLATLPKSPLVP